MIYNLHADHPIFKRIDIYNLSKKGTLLIQKKLEEYSYDTFRISLTEFHFNTDVTMEIMIKEDDNFPVIGYANSKRNIEPIIEIFSVNDIFIRPIYSIGSPRRIVELSQN